MTTRANSARLISQFSECLHKSQKIKEHAPPPKTERRVGITDVRVQLRAVRSQEALRAERERIVVVPSVMQHRPVSVTPTMGSG
jgi:hypothetical protein